MKKAAKNGKSVFVNFIIDIDVFKHSIFVIICNNSDEVQKVTHRKFRGIKLNCENLCQSQGAFWSVNHDRISSIIWIRDLPICPQTVSVVTHESIHAAADMMRTIGLEVVEATEEILAYTSDYITKTILEATQRI